MALGRVEEQVLALQARKGALVAGVLEGADAAERLSPLELLAALARGDGLDEPPPRAAG